MGGSHKHQKKKRISKKHKNKNQENEENRHGTEQESSDDCEALSHESNESNSQDSSLEESGKEKSADRADEVPNKKDGQNTNRMDTLSGDDNGKVNNDHGIGDKSKETEVPKEQYEETKSEMKIPDENMKPSEKSDCMLSRDETNIQMDCENMKTDDLGRSNGETRIGQKSISEEDTRTSHEQKIDELEQEIIHLQENLDTQQQEIKQKSDIIDHKTAENATLLQRCLTMEKSSEEAEKLRREEYKTLSGEIQTLKDTRTSHEQKIDELEQEIIHLQENLDTQQQEIKQKSDIIDHKTAENATLLQKCLTMEKSSEEAEKLRREEYKTLSDETQALKDTRTSHEQKIDELEQEIIHLQENLDTQQQEIKQKSDIIDHKTAENATLLQKCFTMEKSSEEAEKLRREENKTLSDETQALKDELSSAKEENKNLIHQQVQEKEVLEHENSELKEKLIHFEEEMTKHEKIVEDFQEKLAFAEEEINLLNLAQETDRFRRFLEEDTSTESNNVVRNDKLTEEIETKSEDNSPMQNIQNENIEHVVMDNKEMKRSISPSTNDLPYVSITSKKEKHTETFGYDDSSVGSRVEEISLNENVAEDEAVSAHSSETGTYLAQYQGSDETHSSTAVFQLQNITSHEREIERLKQELNVLKGKLEKQRKEIERQDEIINEKGAENVDLLHRCVNSEESAEAAESIRKQCEDLEGKLASARNENENLKKQLEKNVNTSADHERLTNENKSLNESLEKESRASATLKEQIEALTEHISNREDVVNELQRKFEEANREKDELEAKLSSRNGDNSDILANFLKKQKREKELTDELKEMEQNKNDNAQGLEEMSGQLNLKINELESTKKKHKKETEEMKAKFKDELQKKLVECGNLKSERLNITKDLEAAKKEVSDFNIATERLRAEITAANVQIMQLQEALNAKVADISAANVQKMQLQAALDAKEAEKKVANAEITAANVQIMQLQEALNAKVADISAANVQKMQLQAALDAKEAEKKFANECMQKAVREKEEMMYSIGNLKRLELENGNLKDRHRYLLEQNAILQASNQEYGLLRDHIQEYYKAMQDSQMDLQREKERNRYINQQLSKTGHRLNSMAADLHNYRETADSYRRLLEEQKDKFNKLEREMDRLTLQNKRLTEELNKSEQKCFEYGDQCKSLQENLEKSQAEYRELLSQTQEGATDGTTNPLQAFGNIFTSTPNRNFVYAHRKK